MQNKKTKKIHLIGICGKGMSALAILFKELGFKVSGTDEGAFEPIPTILRKNKITLYTKYNPKNIPKDVDLVIIGKNTVLSAEENVETREAIKLGVKIESLPEALANLTKNKENAIVVGSFGKSTMTSLISWCLIKSKKDPSYFIGALPIDFKNHSHFGKGKDFIIEGDEYPSSNTDKRSKFLHFDPASVVLISGEQDHINIFPTEESYKKPYKKLVAKIPKNGLLVYALNGKNNKEIAGSTSCKKVTYSLENKQANWYAENIKYSLQTSFDLMHNGKKIINIKTNLLGQHNIENIVGAGALLLENKKITPENFAKAINSFHGILGRIDLKSNKTMIPIYEGFGSSYEKAKSVFDTLHLHFPDKRLVAIFEPHAFSWRNRKFLKWYKTIFNEVDEVIMLEATGHGKKAPDQLNTSEVWKEAKKYKKIYTAKGEKETLEILKKLIKENDVIALVSSGPMFGLPSSVPKLMEKMFKK